MVKDVLQKKPNIPPGKEREWNKDVEHIEQQTEKISDDTKKTILRLRVLADRLDETWWEYKIKFAVATFISIVGVGIAARKRSLIALGLTIAGIAITIRVSSIKDAKNLEDKELAEKLLKEAKKDFMDLRRKIYELEETNDYARMIYIFQLAESHKVAPPQLLMILLESIFNIKGIPFSKVKPILKRFRRKAVVGCYEKTITIFNYALLVLDTYNLGFTIMELVQNKGSDAAKDLRKIAKDLEDSPTQ